MACKSNQQNNKEESIDNEAKKESATSLNKDSAEKLIELPLKCITNQMPYKSGLVISSKEDLQLPIEHHPAFYGCFDWHSAVHGHWSIIYLLKNFPEIRNADKAIKLLDQNLTEENILKEIEYFKLNKYTKSFERTYGWAWLLKLGEELYTWEDPNSKKWYKNIKPLCDEISKKYIEYLPKLVYPIRVGEHSNTAFGLSFAYDYAVTTNDIDLKEIIESRAKDFYLKDEGCPINWEPSGYDFLSPCLQEIDIMRKVLDKKTFIHWLDTFLPKLNKDLHLKPGEVKDRSDGKLVHLDGLNFSRAWSLYSVAKVLDNNDNVVRIADEHLEYSLNKIADGDYSGEHWLASFALYALKSKQELLK